MPIPSYRFIFLSANRLANFQIGTTNVSPDTTAPAVGSYDACAHSDGALGAGETKSFDCAAKGRYVIVQLKGSNYLTLCEVQVFGGMLKENRFKSYSYYWMKVLCENYGDTAANKPRREGWLVYRKKRSLFSTVITCRPFELYTCREEAL